MRLRTTFAAAVTAAATLAGGAASAAPPAGDGGSGNDTSWHVKHLYSGGNPKNSKDGYCHSRMAGPYPSGTKVVARYRVECKDESDINHTDYVIRVWNTDAKPTYGDSQKGANKRCTTKNDTKRISKTGVAWWGCTYKLTVADKRPAAAQYWESTLYMVDEVAGDAGTIDYESVITYCHDHRKYCNNHRGVPAIRWWLG